MEPQIEIKTKFNTLVNVERICKLNIRKLLPEIQRNEYLESNGDSIWITSGNDVSLWEKYVREIIVKNIDMDKFEGCGSAPNKQTYFEDFIKEKAAPIIVCRLLPLIHKACVTKIHEAPIKHVNLIDWVDVSHTPRHVMCRYELSKAKSDESAERINKINTVANIMIDNIVYEINKALDKNDDMFRVKLVNLAPCLCTWSVEALEYRKIKAISYEEENLRLRKMQHDLKKRATEISKGE